MLSTIFIVLLVAHKLPIISIIAYVDAKSKRNSRVKTEQFLPTIMYRTRYTIDLELNVLLISYDKQNTLFGLVIVVFHHASPFMIQLQVEPEKEERECE
ncbi:hypothetical protein KTT_03070 [Tengunoibacter tsumagoiensis]|uniref:Uncharacterized protein n=1 Tax=Tengunoibacter tsumagoiensis TaxID=2014871 RepID=A0A401ZU39_9CHLR|nr:hypothetical protein KTT_03070 [Tengunoibacter tsumagoiensis]